MASPSLQCRARCRRLRGGRARLVAGLAVAALTAGSSSRSSSFALGITGLAPAGFTSVVTRASQGSDAPGGRGQDSATGPSDAKYRRIPVDKLEIGRKYRGTVLKVKPFGAFVDIGAENHGIVHISRIAKSAWVDDANDCLQEGQEIDVWVISTTTNLPELSMLEGGRGSRTRGDFSPFTEVPADEWFGGTVTLIKDRVGAFVRVTLPDSGAQAVGLVHKSQLKDGWVRSIEDEVEVGQEVQVRVIGVDMGRNQMALSMRHPAGLFPREGGSRGPGPQDVSAFRGISSETWLSGKVVRLASFGAFVSVTAAGGEQAEGLVHISELSDRFVDSVKEVVEMGQQVRVRVTKVEGDRIDLSMIGARRR